MYCISMIKFQIIFYERQYENSYWNSLILFNTNFACCRKFQICSYILTENCTFPVVTLLNTAQKLFINTNWFKKPIVRWLYYKLCCYTGTIFKQGKCLVLKTITFQNNHLRITHVWYAQFLHIYLTIPVPAHSFPVFDENFEFILLQNWLSFQIKHQRL